MIDIDWQTTAQVAGTAVTAGVALAGFLSGPGALRSRLKSDAEILEKLPSGSAAHTRLLGHIEHQVGTIEKLDKEARRDKAGAVIGILMTLGLGWLALYLFDLDDKPWGWTIWPWVWNALGVFIVICAAACLTIVFEALQNVPRDAKDKPITS